MGVLSLPFLLAPPMANMELGGRGGRRRKVGRERKSSGYAVFLSSLASCWWLLLCSRACMTEFETEMEMKEERPEEAAGHGHMGKSATAATE